MKKHYKITRINNMKMTCGVKDPDPNLVQVEDGKFITIAELCRSIDEGCKRFWNKRRG